MDELWAASLLLDIAAKQDAEALAEEETAEDDVAKQLRSMREAMDNGPIDCLLKVRKYTEMLERYEKHPQPHGQSRTMKLEDLRQLLLNTVVEINHLRVILLNPHTFPMAAHSYQGERSCQQIQTTIDQGSSWPQQRRQN